MRSVSISNHRCVWIILLLAVAVRVAYCTLVIAPNAGPAIPGDDDWQYEHLALRALAGDGLVTDGGLPTAQRQPGYPLLLAGVYGLFGHANWAVRMVQCLLGGASCVLLCLLAGRWFSPRVGLVSAGILAVYPMHVWLAGELLAENLTVPGVLVVLLMLGRAWDRPAPIRWAGAGLAAGFVALVHPIVTGLVVGLTALVIVAVLRSRERRWRGALLMAIVLVVPVSGWTVRNRLTLGRLTVSTLGGNTFLGANNVITATDPTYYGWWVNEYDVPGVRQAVPPDLDEVTRSRMFWGFSLRWLRDHPQYWPRLAVNKLIRFYSPFLGDWRSTRGWTYLICYGTLLPLIAAGLWGICRRGWAADPLAVKLLLAVLGYYTAMVVVFWGSPRFRLTIEPLLIALAAAAAVRLADRLRTARRVETAGRWQLRGAGV